MAIVIRKGIADDFDPSKMEVGEFALATDSKEILHCTGSSEIKTIATLDEVGDKSTLTTTNKDTLVDAINEVDANVNALLGLVYPVGAIYLSVVSTSPATLFGGTWVAIQDRFLLSSGSTYTAGSTGGEATHTLTINEMPAHAHDENASVWADVQGSSSKYFNLAETGSNWINTESQGGRGAIATDSTGGGGAHNNMPPYLTVYMWKRTA